MHNGPDGQEQREAQDDLWADLMNDGWLRQIEMADERRDDSEAWEEKA